MCNRPNGTKPFDVNPSGIGDFRITQVCNNTLLILQVHFSVILA